MVKKLAKVQTKKQMIKNTREQAGIVVDVQVAIVINQKSEVKTKGTRQARNQKPKGCCIQINKLVY